MTLMTQLLCAHVSVYVCVCENALSSLAEHEHLSDKTAQLWHSQNSYSSVWGRCRGLVKNIFNRGGGANISYDVI